MVEGKPGTGNTPLEKMLALVFACWYIASILPVIFAHISGSTRGVQSTILGPLLYHILVGINLVLYVGGFNVMNEEVSSAKLAGFTHIALGAVCLVVYNKPGSFQYRNNLHAILKST